MFNRNQILILAALASLFSAIIYGIATYQTPYGCVSSTVGVTLPMPPQGSGLDLQVLTEPCAYVYLVGIVSGSILLILIIVPVKQEKQTRPYKTQRFEGLAETISPAQPLRAWVFLQLVARYRSDSGLSFTP